MVVALAKAGSAMYSAAGADGDTGSAGGPDFGANGATSGAADDDATVEGEFREVGSER